MVLTQISEPVATPMETKLQQVLAATQNPENRALLEAVLAETRQLTAEKRANPFNSEDFYDNAPVGYHSANAAGIIIRANKTLLNMLGYTAAEVIGKMSISHLLDAESRAFFNAHFSAVVKMEFKLRNQELTYVRKDGSTLPILLNVSIIKDANGNFFATHSAITNIAKEKERENELNSLYNSAPCGYYSVDENRMVNRINDTLLSWLGYTRGEVVGQSAYIFIVSQDSEYTKQRRAKLDQGEMVQEAEYFIRRKDGSVFTAILNGVAIKNVTDGTFKIQVVVLDITEHSHLQNELKVTSEQLFQANEDKNKFIGIASHDLQNPITSVLMATELLQKTTQVIAAPSTRAKSINIIASVIFTLL